MSISFKGRHLAGASAAACAVCCAVPILTLLGVAGVAATVTTFVFAGTVFAIVVAIGSLLALWIQRRRRPNACSPSTGPEAVEISATRPMPNA